MYVDSHCHLDFPDLADDLPQVLARMREQQVAQALVVSVTLQRWDGLIALVDSQPHLFASVGVHPGYPEEPMPDLDELVSLAAHPKVVAIGETGLDYFRQEEPLDWQRDRFRVHIRAARQAGLPLIIHTRAAPDDTLRILREEGADQVGGVMHCFTESWEVAEAAMALGFYISLSGIVTFRNSTALQDVARRLPLSRLLIETDAPFLAPVPFRGKRNDPSLVVHVADKIAALRGETPAAIAQATTDNFHRLFSKTGGAPTKGDHAA